MARPSLDIRRKTMDRSVDLVNAQRTLGHRRTHSQQDSAHLPLLFPTTTTMVYVQERPSYSTESSRTMSNPTSSMMNASGSSQPSPGRPHFIKRIFHRGGQGDNRGGATLKSVEMGTSGSLDLERSSPRVEKHASVLLEPSPHTRPLLSKPRAREEATGFTAAKIKAHFSSFESRPFPSDPKPLFPHLRENAEKPNDSRRISTFSQITALVPRSESLSKPVPLQFIQAHIEATRFLEKLAMAAASSYKYVENWRLYLTAYAQGLYNMTSPLPPPPKNRLLGFLPAPLPPNEAERLHKVKALRQIEIAADVVHEIAKVVRWTMKHFDFKNAVISFFDQKYEVIKFQDGHCFQRNILRPESVAAHIMLTSDPVVAFADITKDWRFQNHPLVLGEPFMRSFIGKPLCSPSGTVIGVLYMYNDLPRPELSRSQQIQFANCGESINKILNRWIQDLPDFNQEGEDFESAGPLSFEEPAKLAGEVCSFEEMLKLQPKEIGARARVSAVNAAGSGDIDSTVAFGMQDKGHGHGENENENDYHNGAGLEVLREPARPPTASSVYSVQGVHPDDLPISRPATASSEVSLGPHTRSDIGLGEMRGGRDDPQTAESPRNGESTSISNNDVQAELPWMMTGEPLLFPAYKAYPKIEENGNAYSEFPILTNTFMANRVYETNFALDLIAKTQGIDCLYLAHVTASGESGDGEETEPLNIDASVLASWRLPKPFPVLNGKLHLASLRHELGGHYVLDPEEQDREAFPWRLGTIVPVLWDDCNGKRDQTRAMKGIVLVALRYEVPEDRIFPWTSVVNFSIAGQRFADLFFGNDFPIYRRAAYGERVQTIADGYGKEYTALIGGFLPNERAISAAMSQANTHRLQVHENWRAQEEEEKKKKKKKKQNQKLNPEDMPPSLRDLMNEMKAQWQLKVHEERQKNGNAIPGNLPKPFDY